jgi:hypothetical protein
LLPAGFFGCGFLIFLRLIPKKLTSYIFLKTNQISFLRVQLLHFPNEL